MAIEPESDQRDGLRHAGILAWSLLGILLLIAAGLYLLYVVREMFPPLILALLVIFLLNPLVTALERRGVRRGIGTAMIYFGFLAFVVVTVLTLAPPLGNQVRELQGKAPEIAENVLTTVGTFANRLGIEFNERELREVLGLEEAEATDETVTDTSGETASQRNERRLTLISRILSGIRGFAGRAISAIVIFVLAPIFALYLLIDLPRIQRAAVHYMPPRFREEWLFILNQCGRALGSFFRGQLLVAAIVGTLSSIAFFIWDLPFWLPIGLTAGFFNIIPLVGAFVGGGIATIVGGLTGGPGLAVKVAISSFVIQQIDNHFISPNIMGRAVRLHPVMIMIALLAGGTFAGFWGMLIAIPLLAVLKIVGLHYYETRVLGTPIEEIKERIEGEFESGREVLEGKRSNEAEDEIVLVEDIPEPEPEPARDAEATVEDGFDESPEVPIAKTEIKTGTRGRAARPKP